MTYLTLVWDFVVTISIPLVLLSFILAYAWHCYQEEKEYKLFMKEKK